MDPTRTVKDTKDFFYTSMQRLFSNWTALKLVVEHGMGTREQIADFCQSTLELLYTNDNVDGHELAEHLEDYMDYVFHTELQDNSQTEVANELLRFYRYCAECNEAAAAEEFAKLPPLRNWILTPVAVRDANKPATFDYDQHDDAAEEKQNAGEWEEVKRLDDDARHQGAAPSVIPDEWTEVKTRRKK